MEPTGRTRTSPKRLLAPVAPVAPADLDRLDAIRARPALIEHAVRTALVDAMKWRLGGGGAPAENSFAFAAAAAARQELSLTCGVAAQRPDAASVARAAATAAVRFFRSPLGKRLLTLPRAHIAATAATIGGADVAIRDSAGRLHLIALTTLLRPLDIGARAREVARQTRIAARDRLLPIRIHMFSLVTGLRYESSGWTNARGDDLLAGARSA